MKVLEVSKEELGNNLEKIKKVILEKKANTKIIAVVKANRNGIRTRTIFKISY